MARPTPITDGVEKPCNHSSTSTLVLTERTQAQEIEYFPQSYKAEFDPDPGTPPSVHHPETSSLSLTSYSVLLASS